MPASSLGDESLFNNIKPRGGQPPSVGARICMNPVHRNIAPEPPSLPSFAGRMAEYGEESSAWRKPPMNSSEQLSLRGERHVNDGVQRNDRGILPFGEVDLRHVSPDEGPLRDQPASPPDHSVRQVHPGDLELLGQESGCGHSRTAPEIEHLRPRGQAPGESAEPFEILAFIVAEAICYTPRWAIDAGQGIPALPDDVHSRILQRCGDPTRFRGHVTLGANLIGVCWWVPNSLEASFSQRRARETSSLGEPTLPQS